MSRRDELLTERRDHLDHFAERLQSFTRHLVVLHGGIKLKERCEVIARLAAIPDGEKQLLIATGRYIGEGFDDARLDTLFLALPVSWKGTLIQYTGRLHRLHPGKTEVRIYDYVDHAVPMLMKLFEEAIVDACDESEQTVGFYTMLEDHLSTPFKNRDARRRGHGRGSRHDRRRGDRRGLRQRKVAATCSDSRLAAAQPPAGRRGLDHGLSALCQSRTVAVPRQPAKIDRDGSPLSSITTTFTAATKCSLASARPRRQNSARPWQAQQNRPADRRREGMKP